MSIRSAIVVFWSLGILADAAEAGRSSSGFSVGITIGKPGPARPLGSVKIYTWNAAAISVREAGFDSLVRVGADERQFWFMGERDGQRYRVAVSKDTGSIVKVSFI